MKAPVDSPIVVLLEDRPKQRMVYQLNLSIYLDARVLPGSSLSDLRKALATETGLHLVVIRSNLRLATVPRVIEILGLQSAMIPVICMGDSAERRGMTIIEDALKPLLQTAAKLFDITPQSMVAKKRPNMYEISAEFLNLLFTFPCDIYDQGPKGLEKVFNAGADVPRSKVERLAGEHRTLYIESIRRLKLANAVAEQALKAAEDLHDANISDAKRLSILSASFDIVAAQFQSAGMDAETLRLTNSSIKAMEKIADDTTDAEELLKKLRADGGGYRYVHCQVITFLCFHVIKALDWTDGEQRNVLSQASFYHDISLSADEHAKIHNSKSLAPIQDRATKERIYSHAQLAAQGLQTAPGISPSVVNVVRRHHGSGTGRGFFTRISKFDPLEKAFILAERWCDYLMELADTGAAPRHDEQMTVLCVLFNDPVCSQILDTFRLLSPDKFSSAPVADSVIAAAEATRAQEEEEDIRAQPEEGAAAAGEESFPKVAGLGALAGQALSGDDAERDLASAAGEEETSRTIKNVTYRRTDEASVVQDDSLAEKNVSKTIKNVTYRRADEITRMKNSPEEKDETAKKFKSTASRRVTALVKSDGPEGKKAKEVLRELHRTKPGATIEDAEAALAKAGVELPELAPVEKKISGTTQRRVDEVRALKRSATEEVKGPETSRTFNADAEEKKGTLSTTFAASTTAADRKDTSAAVTDHRVDEEIAVKARAPGLNKSEHPAVLKNTPDTVEPPPTKTMSEVADPKIDEEIVLRARQQRLVDVGSAPGPAGEKARAALTELQAKNPAATLLQAEKALEAAGLEMPELGAQEITDRQGGPEKKEKPKEWNLANVTQVIKEKTFLFKGTGADLVDQTVTRIRAAPRQETRELKVTYLEGSTDLMKASFAGSTRKVAEALAMGAEELKKTDASGRTAVHFAAMGGSVPVLKALVDAGTAINATDTQRRSPLFFAAMYQRNGAFEFLLERGGKVAQQDASGMTIAMLAAHAGNLRMLEAAVKGGVRLEARDEKGRTALDFAKEANQTAVVTYLESMAAKKEK